MITMTVKAKNIRKIIVLIIFIGILLVFCGIIYSKSREKVLSDYTEITDFIKKNGYIPADENFISEEVTIPQEFNSDYNAYNEIQKSQGFDLSKYRGKKAEIHRVRLDIRNEDEFYAELIFSGDILIGANLINLRGGEILPLIKKES